MRAKIVNDIQPHDVDEAIALARKGLELGADMTLVELDFFPEELRSVDCFRQLLASIPGERMFALYRKDQIFGHDDERRMATLLKAAEAGAEYIDVMCDLYDEQPGEVSYDPKAIARQMDVIEACHAAGARVIMSAHRSAAAFSAEHVVEIFRAQAARGVDFVKLVTRCDSAAELAEAKRTLELVRSEIKLPFVFLGSGSFGHEQRFYGAENGCAFTFARIELMPDRVQPTIADFVNRRA